MPGLYSLVYTESAGNTILASRRNAEHQNHIDKMEPQYMDDYSANVTTMRTTEDPGESGSESLATTLQGEITRIRHAILEVKQSLDAGISYWYETPTTNAAVTGPSSATDNALPRFNGTGGSVVQNSNIIVSDLDVLNVKTTDLVTSSVNTTFSSTTVTDASAWDLSAVLAGDYAVASGGSVGLISAVDDGGDQLTVSSWVGGTPSNGETVTVERRGQVEIDNTLTVGDGTGTGTSDPDILINKNTGDPRIRLQCNNSSSNAWDISADNSSNDALEFAYGGSEAFGFRAETIDDILLFNTDITTGTPIGATIYPNNIVQAWGTGSRTIGGSSTASLSGRYNCTAVASTGFNIDIDFNRNMANANYALIFNIESLGTTTGHVEVTSKTTSGFTVFITDENGNSPGIVSCSFSFIVVGQMS